MKTKRLLYISELNVPTKSAHYIQTMKMCSAFSKKVKTTIITSSQVEDFKKIKKTLLLDGYFKINSVFKKPTEINFFFRFVFLIKILFFLSKNKFDYIFTRSVFISTFLAILKIKNVLEIHIPNTGFTKYLFLLYSKLYQNKYQKFILINKKLNKVFNFPKKKFLTLDTCIDLDNFNIKTNLKKNSCVYTGSSYKGKGFELICEIAKKLPEVKFYAYTNKKKEIKKKLSFIKNLEIFDYQNYNKIPKIIKSHKISLMPYSNKINIRSESITAEKYMSSIKLVEYLASGNIIIASNIPVYKNILRDKFNCFLVNPKNLNEWVKKIKFVLKRYKNLKYIRNNSIKTSKQFDINQRVDKILKFYI